MVGAGNGIWVNGDGVGPLPLRAPGPAAQNRAAMRRRRKIDWGGVDWRLTTSEIAGMTGARIGTVVKERRRRAPQTRLIRRHNSVFRTGERVGWVSLEASDRQILLWNRAAKATGLSRSQWIREALDVAADACLGKGQR